MQLVLPCCDANFLPMPGSQPGKGPGKLTLGTAEHYYHTLAGGVNVWTDSSPGSQLGVLVRRMAEPYSTNISQQEIFKYWEAMLAGQPLFPDGIKMLVGSFSQLFGTENGRRLQAWCKKEGWVLVWALREVGADPPGPGSPNGMDMGAPYANRSLDLQVLMHTSAAHNISITNERRLEFDGLWLDVAAALNGSLTCAHPCPCPPNRCWVPQPASLILWRCDAQTTPTTCKQPYKRDEWH